MPATDCSRFGFWAAAARFWPAGRLVLGLTLAAGLTALPRGAVGQMPPPAAAARQAATEPEPEGPNPADVAALAVVAHVNREEITRQELAQEALLHFGPEVLDILINRELISQECQRRKITVTDAEVAEEVERMARHFGLPVDQWYKMLKHERRIKEAQYQSDIIWPMIALRKMAGDEIRVTPEEVVAQYEKDYGPAVKARIIVATSADEATALRDAAVVNPESFGNLAKDHSKDPNSASAKGLIPPIHRHVGSPEIEQEAFTMRDGEISPVIRVGEQYVILKREQLLVSQREIPFDNVKSRLEEIIRERKMHVLGHQVALTLKQNNRVEVYDRDHPPAVADAVASINGHIITQHEVAEAAIQRHGEDVLEGAINRKIVAQACKKAGVTVSAAEIDQELAHMAAENLKLKADQTPDVEGWLKHATEKLKISPEIYRRDVIWPTVALHKLVADKVVVEEDDMRKGFEANYGPRVCCRAIVLSDARMAQKVWEKARLRPTLDNFGDLAAEYSIESGSRNLHGVVPPIRRNGGQPLLEKEAFSLKPGELSSIVQVDGEHYIILMCEKYTDPVVVDPTSVRDMLHDDIFAKKLQVAMEDKFDELKENALVDNFLAGTSHAPHKAEKALVAPVDASRLVMPGK